MKYNIWLLTDEGRPSPYGPSTIWAAGIVDAQRKASDTLATLQSEGLLAGWAIRTVTEAE